MCNRSDRSVVYPYSQIYIDADVSMEVLVPTNARKTCRATYALLGVRGAPEIVARQRRAAAVVAVAVLARADRLAGVARVQRARHGVREGGEDADEDDGGAHIDGFVDEVMGVKDDR